LHRQHGIGQAINIGDYLIGLGYRLVTAAKADIGSDAVADILDRMANAHLRLCDGQGAEMAWLAEPHQHLTPLDALQIYALKTSPAFEAALYSGLRMAGPVAQYEELVPQFCRQLGVGFQILNDLHDWNGDDNNKMLAGQDALSMRPTLLLALAFDAANADERDKLNEILRSTDSAASRLARLRKIYDSCKVFEKAEALVQKSRSRAEALADSVEPEPLRQLLYFLVDTVLADEDHVPAIPPQQLFQLPIVPLQQSVTIPV
jgi:geranylgeranyl diphosphate synthase type II